MRGVSRQSKRLKVIPKSRIPTHYNYFSNREEPCERKQQQNVFAFLSEFTQKEYTTIMLSDYYIILRIAFIFRVIYNTNTVKKSCRRSSII